MLQQQIREKKQKVKEEVELEPVRQWISYSENITVLQVLLQSIVVTSWLSSTGAKEKEEAEKTEVGEVFLQLHEVL